MPPDIFYAKNIDNKNPPLYACLNDSTTSRAISAAVFAVVIPVVIVAVLRALHTLQAAHTADMVAPPAATDSLSYGTVIRREYIFSETSITHPPADLLYVRLCVNVCYYALLFYALRTPNCL